MHKTSEHFMRMHAFFIAIFLWLLNGYASHENICKYLEYLSSSQIGKKGTSTKGEMQIIDTYEEILHVQHKYYNEFLQKGFSPIEAEKYSRVGVVTEDRYWIWLRDPIILPNGKTTAYNRFLPKTGLNGAAGVSVMAVTQDNTILVNIIFRHATREWELELPRGGREKNETSQQAALRELAEETGIQGKNAYKLASIPTDSGILAQALDIFVVDAFSVSNELNREDCEAIHDCIFLSKEQIKQAFVDGYLCINMHGKTIKVLCRDPLFGTALLIAETKGIL